jgi:ATP-dependent Lhr-like helicase
VQVIPDNFLLRLRGEDLEFDRFQTALAVIRLRSFWDDEERWRGVLDSLPGYRLSKFQPLMPPWIEREVIAGYLLDVAGTRRWLASQ